MYIKTYFCCVFASFCLVIVYIIVGALFSGMFSVFWCMVLLYMFRRLLTLRLAPIGFVEKVCNMLGGCLFCLLLALFLFRFGLLCFLGFCDSATLVVMVYNWFCGRWVVF